MDIASALVYQLAHRTGRSVAIVIGIVVLAALALLALVAATAGLLLLESDPIVSAPLRWYQ